MISRAAEERIAVLEILIKRYPFPFDMDRLLREADEMARWVRNPQTIYNLPGEQTR